MSPRSSCFSASRLAASAQPSPSGWQQRPALALVTRAAFVGLALAASACSDADDPASEQTTATSIPDELRGAELLADAAACGAADHEACDVLAPECQARLAEIAACQWGGPGTAPVLPSISVLTRAMVREQIAAQVAPDDAPNPVVVAFRAVAALLGLLPTGFDTDDEVDSTANLLLAQYLPATEQIILVEDARTDPIADNSLLFHELVHAQQDARHDLQAVSASISTVDSLIDTRALFEGEAQFHQNMLELGMAGIPIEPGTYRARLDLILERQREAIFFDPASAWNRSLSLAPYIYGPYQVLDAWLEGGAEAAAARYDEPTGESLRMIEAALGVRGTGELLDPFPVNPIFPAPGSALPVVGDEAYPLVVDRLGAWTIYVLARLNGSDDPDALALAWRGDQIDIFELDAGGYAGRFRVRFDTAENAAEFERVIVQNPNADVRTADDVVIVTLMAEGETPEWLFGPLMAR